MIGLVAEELSKEEALTRIQAAIQADPTLQNFDDRIEVRGKEDEDAAEVIRAGEPRPAKPRPDKPEADAPDV
jgi:hypothetical protein